MEGGRECQRGERGGSAGGGQPYTCLRTSKPAIWPTTALFPAARPAARPRSGSEPMRGPGAAGRRQPSAGVLWCGSPKGRAVRATGTCRCPYGHGVSSGRDGAPAKSEARWADTEWQSLAPPVVPWARRRLLDTPQTRIPRLVRVVRVTAHGAGSARQSSARITHAGPAGRSAA